MKTILSVILVITGLACIALAQTAPAPNPGQAIMNAAVNAALGAAVQQAPTVTSTLGSGVFWGAIATAMGSINLILSGFQQLFGLGAKSSNKTVAAFSAGAVATLQHVAGSPDVSVLPKSS